MSLIEAALEKARQVQEKAQAEERERFEKLKEEAVRKAVSVAVLEEKKPEFPEPADLEHIPDTLPELPRAAVRDIRIPGAIFYTAVCAALLVAVYICWLFLRPEKELQVSHPEVKVMTNSAVVDSNGSVKAGAVQRVAGGTGESLPKPVAKNTKYTLTGITVSGTERLALINDKVLGLGDMLGDATVMYIAENSVVLRVGSQDIELVLS